MISRKNKKFSYFFRYYQRFDPSLKPIDLHKDTHPLFEPQSPHPSNSLDYAHASQSTSNSTSHEKKTPSTHNTETHDHVERTTSHSTDLANLHAEDLTGKSLFKQAAIFAEPHSTQTHTVAEKNTPHLENTQQTNNTPDSRSGTSSSTTATGGSVVKNTSQTVLGNDSSNKLSSDTLNSSHSQITNTSNSTLSAKSSGFSNSTSISKSDLQKLPQENKNNTKTNENLAQRNVSHTADVIGQNLHLPSSSLLGNLSPLLNNFRAAPLSATYGSPLLSDIPSTLLESSNLSFLRNLTSFPGLSLLLPQFVHMELGQGLALYNNTQMHSNLIPFQPNSGFMASLLFQFPEHASLFYSILIGQIAAQLMQRKRDEKEKARRKRMNKYGEVIRTEATPAIDVDVHEGQEKIVEEIETWIRITNKKESLGFWE